MAVLQDDGQREVSRKLEAERHEHIEERTSHCCGFKPRHLDIWPGTMYLLVPRGRNGGYIPFFVPERKLSEVNLI